MTITHDIDMDLLRPGVRPVVCAVQGEAVSRALCFHLTCGGLAWTVPEGVEALIRFGKPDGTGGVYDTLPGGSAACAMAANTVTAVLAPQVLTCPGKVALQLQLRQNQQVLATFGVWLLVEEDPAAGEWASEDYYNQIDVRIRGIFLAEPEELRSNRTSGQIAKMADEGMAPVFVLDGCLLDYVERRSDEPGHGPCVFERLYQEGGRVYVQRVLVDDEGSVDLETEALSGSSAAGLNAAAAALLMEILQSAIYSENISGKIESLKQALASGGDTPVIPDEPEEPAVPEVTLTGISAAYSGGEVPVGTAVTALTGIVVTAHYSDGTSKAVTGYTLSGTISEGSNTVTVSYGGKTAAFAVTGVAEEPATVYELDSWKYGIPEVTAWTDENGVAMDAPATAAGSHYFSKAVFAQDTALTVEFQYPSDRNLTHQIYIGSYDGNTVGKTKVREAQRYMAGTLLTEYYTVSAGCQLVIGFSNVTPDVAVTVKGE